MQLLGERNRRVVGTVIVVTHESGGANCTDRRIHIRDVVIGKIEDSREHHAPRLGADTIMK